MSETGSGSAGESRERRIRAGDAERDRVVAQLRENHEAGRLTAEEFNERMEAALSARWLDELPPLLADLPGPSDTGESEPVGSEEADTGHWADWRYWGAPWGRGMGPHGWGGRFGPPPWAAGRPPWAGGTQGAGGTHGAAGPRGGHFPWAHGPVVPLVPLLVMLAVIGSAGALAHGHFPFPLLGVALLLAWLRPWRGFRRFGSSTRPGRTSGQA